MTRIRSTLGFWGGVFVAIFVILLSLGLLGIWQAPPVLTGIIGLIGGIGFLMRE